MAANYAFLLAAARVLGSQDYGALAALLGDPDGRAPPDRSAAARGLARGLAAAGAGRDAGADAFACADVRLAALATVPLVAVALVLVVPLREILDIDSTSRSRWPRSASSRPSLYPVALGVLQGEQRFGAVAALYVLPFVLRLALFLPLAGPVFGLGGAVYAAVAGGLAARPSRSGSLEPLRRGAGRRARRSEPSSATCSRSSSACSESPC